ncbi:diacylglycerol/lipid kinase family protein [Luteitalea sp.]
MRIVLIANPASGTAQGSDALGEVQQRLRSAGHDVHVRETAAKGDAERFARDSAAAGIDIVVAVGGDGTLNEVVNGVASAPDGLERCAIGLIPAGTGNDFARTLGMAEPDVALAALAAGHERRVDLVSLGDRVFLNASAGGFTAETSANVSSEMKQAVGTLAYLIGGARAVLEYEPVGVRVEWEGRTLEADLQLFAICNGAYIGGGHQLAPTARPDDGLMEVCLVRATSTLDLLALLPRLSSGDHVDDDDVAYFRTRAVTLSFSRTIKINTDGEVLEAARCEYVMRPGAVRLIAPAP